MVQSIENASSNLRATSSSTDRFRPTGNSSQGFFFLVMGRGYHPWHGNCHNGLRPSIPVLEIAAMSAHKPSVQAQDGRFTIDVPWHDAEELQIHLRSLGIRSVAVFDAADRTARLEVLDHGAEE